MRSAFITGAGGYIGSCCAGTLAKQGIAVAVCDISEAGVRRTVDAITREGGTARGYVSDVTDCAAITDCIDRAAEALGGIDIMIHVAGGTARIAGKDAKYLPLAEQDPRVIQTVLDVNLMGAIWCSRAAARHMIAQGRGGKIINFSSVIGYNGLKDCTDYAAAKAGVMGLTHSLAKELGPYKINVNSVAPGIVMRPEETGGDARALGTNVLGIKCTAQDVADLVEFLCSDKARFITGQVYAIDGGRSLSMKGSD